MQERAEIQSHTGWTKQLSHELKEYAVISLYLYICFGAILLYKTAVEIVATALLLWLILLPYVTFRQIGERLGEGRLGRMLFVESAQASTSD
jgi:hypothetical protein